MKRSHGNGNVSTQKKLNYVYYDLFSPSIDEKVEFLRSIIPRCLSGKKVLDLACGSGNMTSVFLEKNAEVTAVDLSKSSLKKLLRNSRRIKCGTLILERANAINWISAQSSQLVHLGDNSLSMFVQSDDRYKIIQSMKRNVSVDGKCLINHSLVSEELLDKYEQGTSFNDCISGERYKVTVTVKRMCQQLVYEYKFQSYDLSNDGWMYVNKLSCSLMREEDIEHLIENNRLKITEKYIHRSADGPVSIYYECIP